MKQSIFARRHAAAYSTAARITVRLCVIEGHAALVLRLFLRISPATVGGPSFRLLFPAVRSHQPVSITVQEQLLAVTLE
jgi:hypothetical protein